MRRKVFSLMMMLLLAVTGFVRAEVVEIGDGTGTTYMVPFNSLYGYSFTEQVFLASEIGTAGTITSISFNLGQSYTADQTNDYVVYMKNVTRETFASNTDYEPVTAADVVFNGQWTIPANTTGWITLDLDTPFAYDGTSNLMIAFDENTSGYSTRYFVYTAVTSSGISYYSDSYNPDPYDLGSYSGSKVVRNNRNNIQLDITAGGAAGGEITVHDGTATNGYVPVYGFYADSYLKSEMVYPAAELAAMNGAAITSMKFYASQTSVEWGNASFQVFMTEVASASISDFAGPGIVVYEGPLSIVDGEMLVNFTTPYDYNGGNLLVGVYNTVKGTYVTSTWYGESVTGASVQGYSYSDLSSISATQRNFLPKTTFAYAASILEPGIYSDPEVLDLGFRPNGAWMRPYVAQLTAVGVHGHVTALESTNPYFTINAEIPATINSQTPVDFTMDHGTATPGVVNGDLVVMTQERGAYILPLTANAYDPVANDVIETATTPITFTDGAFSATVGADMYDNYLLPGEAEDGKDVAYKIQVNEEQLLTVNVAGNNGKWAVYTDFNGEPGPGVDNYYTGPVIGEGGSVGNIPFNVQIGEGTGTTGYFPFYTLYNYSIAENLYLASELEAAGVSTTPFYSLSWYATNAPGYLQKGIKIWMANVSDEALTTTSHSVNNMTLVFDDNNAGMTPAIGWNEFVFNQNQFQWDGHSNLLIFVQRNNGEWNSTVSWQATTGMPFVSMAYRYQDSGAYDPTIANTMYTASTRPNCVFKSMGRANNNRETVELLFDNFEAGNLSNWTVVDADGDGETWEIATPAAYSIGNAYSGTYCASSWSWNGEPYYPDNYMISPLVEGATSINYLVATNDAYPDHYGIFASSTGTNISDFSLVFEENAGSAKYTDKERYSTKGGVKALSTWAEKTVNLPFGTKYVAFRHFNSGDMNYLFVDDVTINAIESSGSQWEPGMPLTLLPGTYYLVASSTDDNFTVTANLWDLPLPVAASDPRPADGAIDITSPVTLKWKLGEYTTEYRVLFGTTYPPEVVVDWTSELAESLSVGTLYNNKNYFWRVDERNSSGETLGQLWGFTTALNVPQNLTAVAEKIYEGDVLTLNWAAVGDRSHRGYNIYQDGVKLNNAPVVATTYNVEGLTYNMAPGYTYNVTAVYDEGESAFSGDLVVFVTGKGSVNGYVYENDGVTPISGATVTFTGLDEFNRPATSSFTTNASGKYNGAILAGQFIGVASKDGYQDSYYANTVDITYNAATNNIDFIMNENWTPLAEVIAEEISDDIVKVYWSMGIMSEIVEDFETGDFTAFPWNNSASYPWTISTTSPYEGTYCMKSGGAGVASVSSTIEVSVEIPRDGLMSFACKVSSESNYDFGNFYLDGTQKVHVSGAGSWMEKEFPITEGVHNFKWEYTKDGSVNSNEDCFYVDYISFFHQAEPTPPGQTVYDFEDSSFQGWTSIDADGDGYNWQVASNVMSTGYGHNGSNDCVLSQSYYGGVVLYPDNYFVSPQVTLGGTFSFYACAQDASYAAEHFGVAVSTTGNTSASAFTMLQEWTMTAKGNGAPTKVTRDGSRVQGNWYQYTIDLSAYAGQTGYVAIRHFNCSDMFYLDVDDIALNNGAKDFAPSYADNANSVHNMYPAMNAPRYRKSSIAERSFNHYNVYRTSCYDETGEDAELIAQVVDTVYMDVAWANLAPGVYKWGVSRVYEGNRESKINWGATHVVEPTADATTPAASQYAGSRDAWDLLTSFDCTSGYQYGVATDGNYIYTSSWSASSTSQFYKYDMNGNFVEEFNVSGSGQIRDLTYDGQYFYGVANASTIYCLDLANHTLVSTISSAYGTMRCCSYDPVRDGFWVVGNWSGNLTLVNRSGAVVTTGAAPTSASGVAYFKDENDVEHVLCFNNANNDIHDYDIASNAFNGVVFNFNATPGYNSGSSGGCHVGDYNGKVAFFGDLQQSPNVIGVYELYEVVTPTPPTPPTPGAEGESDIVWSNCLDHNMYQQVSLSVSTNSGDAVTGAQVSLVNLSEPEMGIAYNVELDESGYYVWDAFRRGEYQLNITLDGFAPISEVVDLYNNNALAYVLEEVIGELENLYVSTTGWVIMGEVTGGTTTPVGPGSTFSVNFDDSQIPAGWTTIDANNDGYNWVLGSQIGGIYLVSGASLAGSGHNSSADLICSGSYSNATSQAITPDNYLVTPQVTLTNGSTFSFWACGQDASYVAEHFGVAVSDNGTSNWTMVQEWTMTAKESGNVMSIGRDGNTRAQGSWHQYTVDLSAFAGQKYIAIRHFNCNDMFILDVDDIELTVGRNIQQYLVRLDGALDGVTTNPFFQHNVDNLVAGSAHTTSVKAVYGTGESDWATFDWVYTPCDEFVGLVDEPQGVMDGQDAVLTWELPQTTGPVNPGNTTFTQDFEGGLGEWTVVDANNDGYTWCLTSAIPTTWTYYASLTLDWYHNGTNAICSGSYINGVGALNPNEYLISPAVSFVNGSSLSFWVAATDASYPADHFGVFVSTTGTEPSDFTSVQEWTLTAKREGVAGGFASRDGQGLRIATWYNYTVDLSQFAGNDGYIAFRHFNCTDEYIMCLDDVELTAPAKGERNPWDLMMTFTAPEGGHYGVAYDGNNFYTSNWGYSAAAYNFYQYDLTGNMLEGFNISGCGTLRGITYDGEFFYGVANSSTVYCVDLANHAVVNTFTSAYGAMRGITYDPERDGFWVIGNWSGNLTLIDRNGAIQQTGPAPTSASDLAYFKDEDGIEHIYCFNNGTNDVEDWVIGNGSMGGSVFNFSSTPGFSSGASSGGCTVGQFDGKTAFIGDLQQSPNLIAIYELAEGTTPVPPVPPVGGGIIGVEIFRDGQWIAEVPYTETTYTDVNPGNFNEYTIRVIHDGSTADWTYYAMSCPEVVNFGAPVCDAPENLEGDYTWTPEVFGATITWTYGEAPVPPAQFEWYYYDDGVNDGAIGAGGPFYWAVMFPAGTYQGGQVAKVAFYDYAAFNGTATIYNDGATVPANNVGSVNISGTGVNDFVEFEFATPVNVDPSKNLWVVLYNSNSTNYPAAGSVDVGEPNARWVSLDGSQWDDLASYGFNYTWMIRAYIGGAKGEVTVLGNTTEAIDEIGNIANNDFGYGPAASASALDNVMFGDPISFNVYRDGSVIANVPFTGEYQYSYFDQVAAGIYDYQVTAVYDGCESDFALTPNGNANYVTVDVTSVAENNVEVNVYPNPTTGNVKIEAAGMNHLTVVSTLGQILFDADVNGDNYEMNLGQYKAGIYMVRIYTENGVAVKRVTVVD